MKHPVGRTRNGIPVYVDLIRSQAAARISQRPSLLGLIEKALSEITASDSEIRIEYDMGHAIGYNFVVETTDEDSIMYAQLLRDNIYTRFVKNGKPLATRYLTILLQRDDQNNDAYELRDTWIGRIRPPRPGSDNETTASKSYWANHAFVLDNQSLQARTVTKVCPY
ncbi:MAG TPA: hypothetical protein VGG13_02045 [Candidatus Saccharimonadales bacterium]|jgi:hypothetical protein